MTLQPLSFLLLTKIATIAASAAISPKPKTVRLVTVGVPVGFPVEVPVGFPVEVPISPSNTVPSVSNPPTSLFAKSVKKPGEFPVPLKPIWSPSVKESIIDFPAERADASP